MWRRTTVLDRGPRLSIALTLFLLTFQVLQVVAGTHTHAKRVAYRDGCEEYQGMFSDALQYVNLIGRAGLQAIQWLELDAENPRPEVAPERRRILWILEALFGTLLKSRDHHGVEWPLAILKGM